MLDNIESSLSTCVRLVRQLNTLLPKEQRLEKFKLHPELEEDSDIEENADGVWVCVCECVCVSVSVSVCECESVCVCVCVCVSVCTQLYLARTMNRKVLSVLIEGFECMCVCVCVSVYADH